MILYGFYCMNIIQHDKGLNMIYAPLLCVEDVYRFLFVIMSVNYSSTSITYAGEDEGIFFLFLIIPVDRCKKA